MYLEGPRARTWPMILSGHNVGHVSLKKGWKSFALDNNLKAGDILVFRLMSKNHLNVQIFGKDGIEKIGANVEDNATNMESSSSDDDDDDDDDDDYDDEVAAITKCRKKKVTLGDDLKRHNVMPIPSSINDDSTLKMQIEQCKNYVTEVYYSQRRPVSQVEKERAIEASKSCQTNNHPSVRKIMMPSHVYRGFWLSFPLDFARVHLPSETQAITLSDDSSTTEWKGKWLGSRKNPGLSGGWRKFSIDHRLEEGDVCIFEIVDKNKVHLKVHIFRVVDLQENNKGYLRKPPTLKYLSPQEDEEEKEEEPLSSRKRKQREEVSQNRIDHEMCEIRGSNPRGDRRRKVLPSSTNGVSMGKQSDGKSSYKVVKMAILKQGACEKEEDPSSSSRKSKQRKEVSRNRIDHEMSEIRGSDHRGDERKNVFVSSINGVSTGKQSDIKSAYKVLKKAMVKQGGCNKEEELSSLRRSKQKNVSQNMINHEMRETRGFDQRGDKRKQVFPSSTDGVSMRKQSDVKIVHKMMKMTMFKQERGYDEEDEVAVINGLHKLQSIIDLRGDKKENVFPSSKDGVSMEEQSDNKIAHKMMERVVVVKQERDSEEEVAVRNGSQKLLSLIDHERGEQRKNALPYSKNGVFIGEQSADKNAQKTMKMGVVKQEQECDGGSLLGCPQSITVKQKKGQFESPCGGVSVKEEQIEITDHCIGLKEVKREQGLSNPSPPHPPISELREGPFTFCKDCRLPELPSQFKYDQNDGSIQQKLFLSQENATDISREPLKKKNKVIGKGSINEKEEENKEDNEEEKMYYDVQRLISRRKGKNEDLFFLVELTQEVDISKISGAVEKEGVAWWVPASYFESGFGRCHL